MKTPSSAPCAEWAGLLAADPEDLSPAQRDALEVHIASCAACAVAREDYARMDALIRGLPAPRPLASLPEKLLALWEEEERQERRLGTPLARWRDGAAGTTAAQRPPLSRQPLARRLWESGAGRAIATVLIVGLLVTGYLTLFAHHRPCSPANCSAGASTPTPDYGPTVEPTGPQPRVGDLREVGLPPGAPSRDETIAAGYEGAPRIVPQTSVPGLLYATVRTLDAGHTLTLWRSADGGGTWTRLTLPDGIPPGWTVTPPNEPDTIFTVASPDGKRNAVLYSLDRGDHWAVLSTPAGWEHWNAGPPRADHGVWYFRIIDSSVDDQPQIWVSRDHGAHWTEHDYPVKLPPYDPNNRDPGSLPFLNVTYSGGWLWPYQRVIWQTSDFGEHWQQLGRLGDAPCDEITGSWDRGPLYCTFWNGAQEVRAYWRSDDRGQTWRAIPPGPPVVRLPWTPGAEANPLAYLYTQQPLLLHDGSLLRLWPTAGGDHTAAFFALAPGANVWKQVSAPLSGALAACTYTPPTSGDRRNRPACAEPLTASLTAGPDGAEMVFVQHAPYDDIAEPLYAAQITWR